MRSIICLSCPLNLKLRNVWPKKKSSRLSNSACITCNKILLVKNTHTYTHTHTHGVCGRIFRSGVCFDAPSHIPYVFVVRVVNKIHIVNIVCWLKSKFIYVTQSKFTKTNPFFSNPGACAGPKSAFERSSNSKHSFFNKFLNVLFSRYLKKMIFRGL